MKLEVVTPEKIAYSDEVDQISLETTDGQITVLPNHIPLVTTIKPGELIVKKKDQTVLLATGDGFAEITKEKISILTDLAEKSSEIDEKAVEDARLRAQKALEERERLSDEEVALTMATLEKALAQLRVRRKHRSHRSSPEISA